MATHEIRVEDYAFWPPTVRCAAGDRLVFTLHKCLPIEEHVIEASFAVCRRSSETTSTASRSGDEADMAAGDAQAPPAEGAPLRSGAVWESPLLAMSDGAARSASLTIGEEGVVVLSCQVHQDMKGLAVAGAWPKAAVAAVSEEHGVPAGGAQAPAAAAEGALRAAYDSEAKRADALYDLARRGPAPSADRTGAGGASSPLVGSFPLSAPRSEGGGAFGSAAEEPRVPPQWHTVVVGELDFRPAQLQVAAGATVLFRREAGGGGATRIRCGGCFEEMRIAGGSDAAAFAKQRFAFDSPGTFLVEECSLPFMRCEVTVVGAWRAAGVAPPSSDSFEEEAGGAPLCGGAPRGGAAASDASSNGGERRFSSASDGLSSEAYVSSDEEEVVARAKREEAALARPLLAAPPSDSDGASPSEDEDDVMMNTPLVERLRRKASPSGFYPPSGGGYAPGARRLLREPSPPRAQNVTAANWNAVMAKNRKYDSDSRAIAPPNAQAPRPEPPAQRSGPNAERDAAARREAKRQRNKRRLEKKKKGRMKKRDGAAPEHATPAPLPPAPAAAAAAAATRQRATATRRAAPMEEEDAAAAAARRRRRARRRNAKWKRGKAKRRRGKAKRRRRGATPRRRRRGWSSGSSGRASGAARGAR